MREFGSDFHVIKGYQSDNAHPLDIYRDKVFLADGRHCIEILIRQYGWKRLWMPEYFCYNIIEYLQKKTGIEIVFYVDYPGNDDNQTITNLDFQIGDALLRMNYFGSRSFRSEKSIPVPVIEDHSHDLIGEWAKNSDADWCIASLRKIIPIPEGGVMWSPKRHHLEIEPQQSTSNISLAQMRWNAMEEKEKYLSGALENKELFRKAYLETEEGLDELDIALIDERSRVFLKSFDIERWYKAKKRNWQVLCQLTAKKGLKVLLPEASELVPFSFVVLFDNNDLRERVKKQLISSSVYPAVLWSVPDGVTEVVRGFSQRMLSIHCDGRYSEEETYCLLETINSII